MVETKRNRQNGRCIEAHVNAQHHTFADIDRHRQVRSRKRLSIDVIDQKYIGLGMIDLHNVEWVGNVEFARTRCEQLSSFVRTMSL